MRVRSSTGADYKQISQRRAAAFTLAEVMVAVALGGIMLTALFAGLTFGFGAVKLAREDLRATQILVEQTESVRLTPYSSLKSYTTNTCFDPVDQASGSGGTVYSISITTNSPSKADLAPLGANPASFYYTNMLKITATATWTNANIARTRTLVTYAAKFGVQAYINQPH
jgi:type II secretory pathway pseudopilin PulG